MQRKHGELVPIGDALSDLGGPVQALREASPQARHHFTQADQVNQLVGASEAAVKPPSRQRSATRRAGKTNWRKQMIEMRKMRMLLVASMLAICSIPAWAQFSFKKVEVRTSFGAAEEGNKGKLLIDTKRIRFTKKNESTEYFSIPAKAVTEVFYSRVSGRRIGAAILVTPLLLFTKGRKHYMTLSFNDGAELAGAVEFKLHKSNYRGVLRTIEQVTDKSMLYDQEGVKDTKQTVAAREGGGANQSILKITSDPEGAEIEIDGSFTGDSPRSNAVAPGKYKLKLRKKGYKDWERKVTIAAGQTLEVNAEMESK